MDEHLKKALEIVGQGEVRLEETQSTGIRVRNGQVEDISVRQEWRGSVRAFYKGSWGFATFSVPEEAPEAARRALELAKAAGGSGEGLAPVPAVQDEIGLSLSSENPADVPLERKVELALNYSKIMAGVKGVVSAETIYSDSYLRETFLNTDGSRITQERVYARVALSATAAEGSNVQTRYTSFGDQRGFGVVLGREADAQRVAEEAAELLSAEKVTAGTYTVILNPAIAGVFIHEAFGHLSEADHLHRNERLKAVMRVGERFGPEFLNVTDKPVPGEWGYYKYDHEGVEKRTTFLIKDGVLSGRLHSRQTAWIMGDEPTGNARAIDALHQPLVRMSATCIEPGEAETEEVLDIPEGLLVIDALGGMTEMEMFTFTAQKAYLIKGGKPVKLVRDVVLSGNVFETLKNIEKIGKEGRFWVGGCGKGGQYPLPVSTFAPYVRIKGVLVGGK